MASYFEDPTQWRWLTPASLGTPRVPFREVSFHGDYGADGKATATVEIIIPSNLVREYLEYVLPPPKAYGRLRVPQYYVYFGTGLAVTKAAVKSFDTGLPIDPYQEDTDAPPNTYHKAAAITLSLGVRPTAFVDPDRPVTFLEVNGESTGEFIHSPNTGDMTMTENDDDGNPIPNTEEPVRVPNIPHTVLSPEKQWTLKWRQIPIANFRDVVVPRLDDAIGKVNEDAFEVLHTADPGTLLFLGYTYEEYFTWHKGFNIQGTNDESLVDVTMKMMEKRVVWGGGVYGHQAAWIPQHGWRTIKQGDHYPFETHPYANMFNKNSNTTGAP